MSERGRCDVTAIEAVSCYLPRQRVSVEDMAAQFELTSMQIRLFRRFLGLAEIRLDPGESLVDLLRAGAAGLAELRGREHLVRYVIHARVMPVVVPYPVNPLREVCRSLGLRHAISFAVTHHACASALLAIDLAGRLLAADGNPDALALILTGEKAFTRDAQILPGISMFGEAAAACLVRSDGPRDRVLAYASNTRGEFFGRLDEPGMASRYEEQYPDSLAEVIQAAISRAGLGIEEIALVLPHNVNVMSWRKLCRRISFPVDRVLLDNVPVTGHAFCSDVFVNYTTAAARGLLRPGVRYVLAGAGLGATFSAMVVEH
jgi:3-oxoacyl-[acyl-carrier-protein] synthase-3